MAWGVAALSIIAMWPINSALAWGMCLLPTCLCFADYHLFPHCGLGHCRPFHVSLTVTWGACMPSIYMLCFSFHSFVLLLSPLHVRSMLANVLTATVAGRNVKKNLENLTWIKDSTLQGIFLAPKTGKSLQVLLKYQRIYVETWICGLCTWWSSGIHDNFGRSATVWRWISVKYP